MCNCKTVCYANESWTCWQGTSPTPEVCDQLATREAIPQQTWTAQGERWPSPYRVCQLSYQSRPEGRVSHGFLIYNFEVMNFKLSAISSGFHQHLPEPFVPGCHSCQRACEALQHLIHLVGFKWPWQFMTAIVHCHRVSVCGCWASCLPRKQTRPRVIPDAGLRFEDHGSDSSDSGLEGVLGWLNHLSLWGMTTSQNVGRTNLNWSIDAFGGKKCCLTHAHTHCCDCRLWVRKLLV